MKRYIKSTVQGILDLDFIDRLDIAADPDTSPVILESLSRDSDWGVRQVVAINPNIDETTLRELSNDGTSGVRCGVARNPNTPMDILMRLTEDSDYWVRRDATEYADKRFGTNLPLH